MLKPKLDTLEDLSEELQGYYEKRDNGFFYLRVEDSELKTSFNKQKEENQSLKKELANARRAFEEQAKKSSGTLEEYKQKIDEYENQNLSADELYKKAIAEKDEAIKALHEHKINSKKEFSDFKLKEQINKSLLSIGASSDPMSLDYLTQHVFNNAKYDTESGEYVFLDKNKQQDKRLDDGRWVRRTTDDAVLDLLDSGQFNKFFDRQIKKGYNTSSNMNSSQRRQTEALYNKYTKATNTKDKFDAAFELSGG